MFGRAAVGVLCVAIVAGCTTSAAPTTSEPGATGPTPTTVAVTSAAPSASPSSEPTPQPTLSVAELAKAYLACVSPYNSSTAALWKQYKNATTLKAWRTYSAKVASAEGTFMTCVRAIAWTPELQGDVKALLKANATLQVTLLAESKATSFAQYNKLVKIDESQQLAASSASNVVRGDLGLPPPPI